ncbi:MAG: hypothetical protein DWB43_12640 [Lautropia sp.]|nr:MAG: hypothetical protein EDM78_04475 [Pseudomonadota bacterium]MBC6960360.1 hypothetical protein [Lautropia sp.]MCL4702166.1 hypothetical protein [Burkholderiaceae bacterium]MCZ2415311.1 hypothetical protein [Burkholderiales bacterium]MDL1908106.1 hypothetical protein [Betaproteobacteria bacterium PRO1]NUN94453.1 hypothetical protein [Verrucomicrobiae bacterium]
MPRTTINVDEDAFLAAKEFAARERVSIDEAVSRLIRRGIDRHPVAGQPRQPVRGRFALLTRRDEVIEAEGVREIMEREEI